MIEQKRKTMKDIFVLSLFTADFVCTDVGKFVCQETLSPYINFEGFFLRIEELISMSWVYNLCLKNIEYKLQKKRFIAYNLLCMEVKSVDLRQFGNKLFNSVARTFEYISKRLYLGMSSPHIDLGINDDFPSHCPPF